MMPNFQRGHTSSSSSSELLPFEVRSGLLWGLLLGLLPAQPRSRSSSEDATWCMLLEPVATSTCARKG